MFGSLESDVTSFHGPLLLGSGGFWGYTDPDSHDVQDFQGNGRKFGTGSGDGKKASMETGEKFSVVGVEPVLVEVVIVVVMGERK